MPGIVINPNFDPAQQRRSLIKQMQDNLPEIISALQTQISQINYRFELIDELLTMAGFTEKEVEDAKIIVDINVRIRQEQAKENAAKQQ